VWCGILGVKMIGPHFIDDRFNRQNYAQFLTDTLPSLLEEVSLNVYETVWYQHDGCGTLYARVAREAVDNCFPHCSVGRVGNFS
jgi:hypothetical protein